MEEGIQKEGFSNLWERIVSCKNHVFSSSLQCEGFDIDEEINNTMNGIPQDEYDGYNRNIFMMPILMALWKKNSNFMNEGWNEEENGEEK